MRQIKPNEAIPIPEINRKLVALHIALQFLRTADSRDILSAFIEQELNLGPLSKNEKRLLHTDLLWDEKFVSSLADHFQQATWVFGRNLTSTPFMTSDNPIAFRTNDNRQWVKVGVTARAYVVFPLAKDIILYCYPQESPWDKLSKFDKCLSPVEFDQDMVESENSGQVFMASRFVISPCNHFDAECVFAKTIGTDTYAPRPTDDDTNEPI